MKSKKRLFVLGLIAVGIGGWLWVTGEDMPLEHTAELVAVEQAESVVEDRVITPQMFEPQYLKVVSGEEDFTPEQREKMRELGLPEAVVRRALQAIAGSLSPVNFHLKIVDQNGDSVPGVKIEYDVSRSPGFVSPGRYVGLSDEQGWFSLAGTKAATVDLVSFTKPGYVFRATKKESSIAAMNEQHLYTSDAPLIVHAWKLGKPAKLLEYDGFRDVYVPNDGSWTSLYLILHRKLVTKEGKQPDADFWVSVVARFVDPTAKIKKGLDWSMELEVPNGGLLKSEDLFLYEAPESGYEPRFSVNYEADDPAVLADLRKNFYILLRSGEVYGRMQFSVYPFSSLGASVWVKFALNLEGKRNLYGGKPMQWY